MKDVNVRFYPVKKVEVMKLAVRTTYQPFRGGTRMVRHDHKGKNMSTQ